jgi:putative flippase GtrA
MVLKRLARFGAIGVLNTGIYYAVYLVLRTQITYLLAHVCAFVVAMICSYFLNCYLTFRTRPTWRTFLLFPLSNVANFVLTTVGLRVAVAGLGIDQRIAPLAVAVFAIPLTYILAHHIMIGRLSGPAQKVGDAQPSGRGSADPR